MSLVIEKAIRKGTPQTTLSGYGSRLRTSIMVHCAGKWGRVYAVCYGNAPSVYVII